MRRAFVYRDGVDQPDEYYDLPHEFCPRTGISFAIWVSNMMQSGDVQIVIRNPRYFITPAGVKVLTRETTEGQ